MTFLVRNTTICFSYINGKDGNHVTRGYHIDGEEGEELARELRLSDARPSSYYELSMTLDSLGPHCPIKQTDFIAEVPLHPVPLHYPAVHKLSKDGNWWEHHYNNGVRILGEEGCWAASGVKNMQAEGDLAKAWVATEEDVHNIWSLDSAGRSYKAERSGTLPKRIARTFARNQAGLFLPPFPGIQVVDPAYPVQMAAGSSGSLSIPAFAG